MNGVNLIPASRRLAQKRRHRMRLWVAMASGHALLVMTACVGARFIWGSTQNATAGELTAIEKRNADLNGKIADLRRQVADAELNFKTAESISDHPDWNILLSLLNGSIADEIILREVLLTPEPGAKRHARFSLQLRGFAKSQAGVSQFVLRLQKIGLFDDVKLLRTGREPLLNTQAVSFDISCGIGEEGKAKP